MIDNELDNPLALTYTVAQGADYISSMKAIIVAKTNVPVLTKFMGYWSADSIVRQAAMLPYTQMPCYDTYQSSAANFTTACTSAKFYGGQSNFWMTECGAPNATAATLDNAAMTVAMINAMFAGGATMVSLYVMNRHGAGQTEANGFFDTAGAAKTNLTDNLAPQIATWQAAI
jgi:hypothetical protein